MNKSYRITGGEAILAAVAGNLTLHKYADPIDGERTITIDEAYAIAREDAGLIYVTVTPTGWTDDAAATNGPDYGGLQYGNAVTTPLGAGTVTHLCSDIDEQSGNINVLLATGESWHGHHSLVSLRAAHYFTCPRCGGHCFGRDVSRGEDGEAVLHETGRCHTWPCRWHGNLSEAK